MMMVSIVGFSLKKSFVMSGFVFYLMYKMLRSRIDRKLGRIKRLLVMRLLCV